MRHEHSLSDGSPEFQPGLMCAGPVSIVQLWVIQRQFPSELVAVVQALKASLAKVSIGPVHKYIEATTGMGMAHFFGIDHTAVPRLQSWYSRMGAFVDLGVIGVDNRDA